MLSPLLRSRSGYRLPGQPAFCSSQDNLNETFPVEAITMLWCWLADKHCSTSTPECQPLSTVCRPLVRVFLRAGTQHIAPSTQSSSIGLKTKTFQLVHSRTLLFPFFWVISLWILLELFLGGGGHCQCCTVHFRLLGSIFRLAPSHFPPAPSLSFSHSLTQRGIHCGFSDGRAGRDQAEQNRPPKHSAAFPSPLFSCLD